MIALKKVEVDVSEGTFTLFLRYLYGSKMDVEEIAELEALVEIHSLACQFDQRELREEVVGKMRNLLKKESRGLCDVVELRNLLSKHKVEELVPLVKESQVKAEDLEGLLAIARKGGSQSKVRSPVVFGAVILKPCAKVAEEMVVRYLNSACPTTRELAAFAASTSKELLPDEMLATIIKVHTLDLDIKSLLAIKCANPLFRASMRYPGGRSCRRRWFLGRL